MYMTQEYKPIEYGVFTVGSYYNWAGIMVPPNVDSFQNDYSCRTSCLDVSIAFMKFEFVLMKTFMLANHKKHNFAHNYCFRKNYYFMSASVSVKKTCTPAFVNLLTACAEHYPWKV